MYELKMKMKIENEISVNNLDGSSVWSVCELKVGDGKWEHV